MAQYDVYANASNSAADGIPCVVVIQRSLLDAPATRLTVPLAVPDASTKAPSALGPVITVRCKRFHALAHYAAPLPSKLLRRPVDNVAAQANALVSAIDAVLSGIQFTPCAAASTGRRRSARRRGSAAG
jgi:toxin CcdB